MNKDKILGELKFKAVRSSGAGGQHVNKVASKVELSFDVANSLGLKPEEKERLQEKISHRLTNEGVLVLQCDEARSQHQNKKQVVERFFDVLKKALYVPKKRKRTRPSKSSIEKRLKSKRRSSEKKINRKKPDF
ncbi:alternative ribosome rescue aminoacyl-tRNA hydrolase ArfB [Allomuricauda sp. d1]|uniref:alternative ribosome rescue aminoacyl-tRNA hydrolase ArfB n=1 Tax=Allomuricauda sp. d1 TaxID=3136725 RepID=UPI0031D41240